MYIISSSLNRVLQETIRTIVDEIAITSKTEILTQIEDELEKLRAEIC